MRCLATERTLAGPQAHPRCHLKSPTMGEEGGGRRCGTTKELQKRRQQALEYYREHDVPRRLEELLNSTFYLQPADVYGHLVGTWDKHPRPSSPSPPARRCGRSVRLRRRARTRAAARGACSVVAGRRSWWQAAEWKPGAKEFRERESGEQEAAKGKGLEADV